MEGEEETYTPTTIVKDSSDEEVQNDTPACDCSKITEKEIGEDVEEVPCTCQSTSPSHDNAFIGKPKVTKKRITAPFEKKPKLRTSKDVYDRLKWDSKSVLINNSSNQVDSTEGLDTASVFIGYKDRFLGMCELPYEDYVPGGDIPFHRVYYFRTGGPPVDPFIGNEGEVKVREDNLPEGAIFIWDRDTRTDLVFHSGNSTKFS